MKQLLNRADVAGMFDGVDIDNYTELSVELTALDITKTANQAIWVKDDLEYTITVTNMDDVLPVNDVEVTDIIDPTIAKLIVDSVYLGSVHLVIDDTFTYDEVSGKLTIPSTTIGSIPGGASREITFRVEFAQP